MPAAVLALQVLKRARPARGAPSRSASFQPQAEEKRRTLYTRLRNTVAGMASAAVGRARAAFWATRLPIAKEAAAQVANEAAAQKSGSPQARASRATIRHRQLLDQLGLSQREMASDGKCFVSHPHCWLHLFARYCPAPVSPATCCIGHCTTGQLHHRQQSVGQRSVFTAVLQASATLPLPHAIERRARQLCGPLALRFACSLGPGSALLQAHSNFAQSSALPLHIPLVTLGALGSILFCPGLLSVACRSAASPWGSHIDPVQVKTAAHCSAVCKLHCFQTEHRPSFLQVLSFNSMPAAGFDAPWQL